MASTASRAQTSCLAGYDAATGRHSILDAADGTVESLWLGAEFTHWGKNFPRTGRPPKLSPTKDAALGVG